MSDVELDVHCTTPNESNTEPSEAQKAQRERFAAASAYAKSAMAAQQGKSVFAMARSDYLSKETDACRIHVEHGETGARSTQDNTP
jgi:hypothetical protein